MKWEEKARTWAESSRAYMKHGGLSLVEVTASWQREQLLSDETVERAAEAIAVERFRQRGITVSKPAEVDVEVCKDMARAALNAAVGGS